MILPIPVGSARVVLEQVMKAIQFKASELVILNMVFKRCLVQRPASSSLASK